jgi:hypothetical protein
MLMRITIICGPLLLLFSGFANAQSASWNGPTQVQQGCGEILASSDSAASSNWKDMVKHANIVEYKPLTFWSNIRIGATYLSNNQRARDFSYAFAYTLSDIESAYYHSIPIMGAYADFGATSVLSSPVKSVDAPNGVKKYGVDTYPNKTELDKGELMHAFGKVVEDGDLSIGVPNKQAISIRQAGISNFIGGFSDGGQICVISFGTEDVMQRKKEIDFYLKLLDVASGGNVMLVSKNSNVLEGVLGNSLKYLQPMAVWTDIGSDNTSRW